MSTHALMNELKYILLDSFLTPYAIIRNYAFGLCLGTFLALQIANSAQASSFTSSAIQAGCLLLTVALLRRIGAGWRPVFHVNNAEACFEYAPIAAKEDDPLK